MVQDREKKTITKSALRRVAAPKQKVAEKAVKVQEGLALRYPTPATHLIAHSPWQLLVATVLSAQCTDERVNKVTPALFERWPTAEAMATADVLEIEEYIKSTGFYHNKAKNLLAAAQRVMQVYGGEIPRTMQDLCTLGGVARKTANVVLWGAFGLNEGIAVDTHVGRIAMRLGLTTTVEPLQAEKQLMKLFPKEEWGRVNHRLVWFGRHICIARSPKCDECEFFTICDAKGVDTPKSKPRKKIVKA